MNTTIDNTIRKKDTAIRGEDVVRTASSATLMTMVRNIFYTY